MLGSLVATGLVLAAPSLPEGVQVQWTAAPGCPDEALVQRRVAALLEGREGPVRASVVVAVTSGAQGRYRLALDVTLPEETVHRELESAHCDVLADATVVVVGIAIDPQVPAEEVRTAALSETEPEAGLIPAPVDDPPPQPSPGPSPAPLEEARPPAPEVGEEEVVEPAGQRRRVGGFVRLHGGGTAGIVPNLAGVVGLRLGPSGRRWRAELGADYTLATRAAFPAEPGVGADFSSWSVTGRGCGVPSVGALQIPLCAGPEVGWIRAEGFGADINRTVVEMWAGLVVAPGLVWFPHPNVGIGGSVDGFVALRRPAFDGESRPLLHRSFPVAIRATAGLEVRFGGTAADRALSGPS